MTENAGRRKISWSRRVMTHLNFFRIHLLYFIFLPLVVSGLFFAADKRSLDGNQDGIRGTSYIDSLFLCYSAMTATGLTPINLSSLRPLQQAFLFILMLIGDITVVSLVMVLVRKRFFRKHCQELLEANHFRRTQSISASPSEENGVDKTTAEPASITAELDDSRSRVCESPEAGMTSIPSPYDRTSTHVDDTLYGMQTEGFRRRQGLRARTRGKSLRIDPVISSPKSRQETFGPRSPPSHLPLPVSPIHTGHGGFPSPFSIFSALAPSTTAALHSRLAQPVRQHTVLASAKAPETPYHSSDMVVKVARWLPESISGLVIGRNSRFWVHELSDEELEVIGGVEYRALRVLSYMVAAYFALTQLIPFAIIAPYMTLSKRWRPAFEAQGSTQIGSVDPSWASLYMVAAGYTGCGMSLVDLGMLPFGKNYLLIFSLIFPILAGNHALPIWLRLCVWLGTKVVKEGGEMDETLHFLLDHPRRCFLYLFPSHQTWYLTALLLGFTVIEMAGFFLLNLGLPVLTDLGPWQKFADGLFQSLSVRASGFGILPVAQFAPALLFLYVGLMYVAIYPISLSIRGTNVYEERALGVFDEPDEAQQEPKLSGQRHEIFSKYLMWHVRKQLAFDIWPLALGIFLVCILERKMLMDDTNAPWFNIFRVVFELVSAYATIGLSLGIPTQNYSFMGSFSAASKLVVICVMLRGRHRGLPVAIDRAIMLPKEYSRLSPSEPNKPISTTS